MHSSQPKSILSAHLPSTNPDVVWLALIERAVKDLALGGLRHIVGHYLQQAPRQSELLTKSDCRTTHAAQLPERWTEAWSLPGLLSWLA